MRKPPSNKIIWTNEQLQFIKDNWSTMNNRQLSEALGVKPHSVRVKRYELDLYKLELEFWTEVQIKWLIQLYPYIGDQELAQIFNEAYPKKKGWTLKHIEKKRKYLKLKRTKEQLQAIKQRNKFFACWAIGSKRMWEKRDKNEIGTIVNWHPHTMILTEHGYESLNRYTWKKYHGTIPKGMNVVRIDTNGPLDDINNLQLISCADLSKRNSKISSIGLSDNYVAGIMTLKNPELRTIIKDHPALIELKRQQLKLNRTIYDQQKTSVS